MLDRAEQVEESFGKQKKLFNCVSVHENCQKEKTVHLSGVRAEQLFKVKA